MFHFDTFSLTNSVLYITRSNQKWPDLALLIRSSQSPINFIFKGKIRSTPEQYGYGDYELVQARLPKMELRSGADIERDFNARLEV